MKTIHIFLCLFSIFFFGGCSPDKEIIKEKLLLPTVETIVLDNPQYYVFNTKILGLQGKVISDGGKAITEVGFCYSSSGNPDISGSHLPIHAATSAELLNFTADIESLTDNTTYNIRAYATNLDGTAYGNIITFVTDPTVAILSISQLKNKAATSAVIETLTTNGNHIDEKGICYSTSSNPTISNNVVNAQNGAGIYLIKELSPSTTYYVRGYAKSYNQVGYTQSQTFTTLPSGTSQQGEVFICDGIQTTAVVPITSITGRVWMDRNLGSSKLEDNLWGGNFGGFYQWGRGNDGHASVVLNPIEGQSYDVYKTIDVRSSTDTPNNPSIIHDNTDHLDNPPLHFNGGQNINLLYDWRISPNDNLWQGVNGINNPCPLGYRLPTLAELEAEMNAYNITDHISALNSPFKFPVRSGVSYWTSTINNTVISNNGNFLYGGSMVVFINPYSRTSVAKGRVEKGCIRCIKD